MSELVEDAARAQERHGDDELEAYLERLVEIAKACWSGRGTDEGLARLGAFVDGLRFQGGFNYTATYELFRRAVGVDLPGFEAAMQELDAVHG